MNTDKEMYPAELADKGNISVLKSAEKKIAQLGQQKDDVLFSLKFDKADNTTEKPITG